MIPDGGRPAGEHEERKTEAEPSDERGPVGPFPSWKALYVTVVVYAALTIVLLYAFTVLFDRSGP